MDEGISPVALSLKILNGKWKIPIIRELLGGPKRFSELKASLSGITQKILSDNLQSLEANGVVERIVYPEKVLHVEYTLTHIGARLEDVVEHLTSWGLMYAKHDNTRDDTPEPASAFYIPNHAVPDDYDARLARASAEIRGADAILVGAGSGFTTCSGIDLSDRKYARRLFPALFAGGLHTLRDMVAAYSEISSSNESEYWRFWSKYLHSNVFHVPGCDAMEYLGQLLTGKDYFIITTNSDRQFHSFGFDHNRIFAPLGDYTLLQCNYPCCDDVYDAKDVSENLNTLFESGRSVPPSAIPRCPHCGDYLVPNHWQNKSIYFVNSHFSLSRQAYREFVWKFSSKRLVLLELGCGLHFPAVIRNPFETLAAEHGGVTLLRLNEDNAGAFETRLTQRDNFIPFTESITEVLYGLCKNT